jgi:hypothetical protein
MNIAFRRAWCETESSRPAAFNLFQNAPADRAWLRRAINIGAPTVSH